MKFFDSNIHLPSPKLGSCGKMLDQELSLSGETLVEHLNQAITSAKGASIGANFMIFNQWLHCSEIRSLSRLSARIENFKCYLTLLASPRQILSIDTLSDYKECGVRAIKFHSYIQKISNNDYSAYIKLAKSAEMLKMPIFIDASYGSLKMYEYDNLELVSLVAQSVENVPIVILHSGGARALEALLLAESAQNIFLDMSFSIHYYKNSTIEQDFAFAYKKIGASRVFYGSDHPYINHENALNSATEFMSKYKFNDQEMKAMLCDTFLNNFL